MTTLGGRHVNVVRRGDDGSPVLLLHGIGGASASFTRQLDGFAGAHRASAWDAPGYGDSADPGEAPGMSGYAAVAAEALAGEAAHVVGVSWGGVIATRLAVERPDLVRSLVLADSSRGSGRAPEGADRMLARAEELATSGAAEFARSRGPRLVSPLAEPSVVDRIVDTMSRVRLPGYRFAAQSMAETDHTGTLDALTVPTLIVVGEEDRVTGVPESHRLAEGIAGGRLEILAGAGHAANQERPHEFNRVVLDFLYEVDSATAPRKGGAAV